MTVSVTATTWHIKQVECTPSTPSICLHLFQHATFSPVHVTKLTSPSHALSVCLSRLIFFFLLATYPLGKRVHISFLIDMWIQTSCLLLGRIFSESCSKKVPLTGSPFWKQQKRSWEIESPNSSHSCDACKRQMKWPLFCFNNVFLLANDASFDGRIKKNG